MAKVHFVTKGFKLKPLLLLSLLAFCGCGSAQKPKPVASKVAVRACEEGSQYGMGGTGEPFHYYICKAGKYLIDADKEKKADADALEYERKEKIEVERRKNLWNALRTGVISDAEMAEVLKLGTKVIPNAIPTGPCGYWQSCIYQQEDWDRQRYAAQSAAEIELQNALLNQFKMRLAAKESK